ncbi:hypothetical protein B9Z65_5327 [Elsinoe australis]|uniref:Uncharacterized protein n=1 Tax=Elsinoe australis TaxID=40998 RepID=A0A2P7ZDS7_9PEZI|nr:hypothetical protein B9Z65_5327 [Elsinoe australis]
MTIEAQSLASISDLAFNPPAHASDILKHASSALTLYIVRVPGSRDVFLTPLKPRDRVVNAQDVQSSLYFLHVDSPEDVLVKKAHQPVSPVIPEDATTSIGRKPVGGLVMRKPLPTPPASPGYSQDEPSPSAPSSAWNTGVPLRKSLVPRRSPERELHLQPIPTTSAFSETSSSLCSELEPCQTLTLIRRDPSSGDQWNIAKIQDPPVDEVSSESFKENSGFTKRIKNSGSPLFIDIQNSGYVQFIVPDLPPRGVANRASLSPAPSPSPEERVFQRRLWMDGSRFANHTYASRRPLSVATNDASSASSLNLSVASSRPSLSTVGVDRRSKGYAFYDVWGNKCEFSTASTGRSLKCRQICNAPIMSDNAGFEDVSELRFNLPSHHFSAKSESSMNAETDSRRKSYFSASKGLGASSIRNGHTRNSTSEVGTVDYSLGRERAGGGFGGRDAKLGKLIVEDMGLKMLDLVVAANMALWWRAYERCS